ncbi:MAG: delta-60 repeat domain-containing protein [Planctomycetota bacterium]|nr:delta-60 repeat domain-containing protein [Planctomycetota bacterium]
MIRDPRSSMVAAMLTLSLIVCGCNSSSGSSNRSGGLAPPQGVTATAGLTDVTIMWNPVSGADSYNLYWSTTAGVTKANGTLIAGVVSPFMHTGLMSGTTHYYVLTTLRGTTEGVESIEVSATPMLPNPPSVVTATAGIGQVTIEWGPVPGADSYNLYWATAPGVTTATGTQIPGVLSPYDHNGLLSVLTYYYVLTTVQQTVESTESMEVFASPFGPSNLGVPDTTFAGVGWTSHDSAAGGLGGDWGRSVAVDSQDRIVIAGQSTNANGNVDMVIWRLNDDGTFDTTFNGQGWFFQDGAAGGGGGRDIAWGVAIDSADRIVATGQSLGAASVDADVVVWRLETDGTLDTTFGTGGWVVFDNPAPGFDEDEAYGIALDSMGRIVLGGATGPTGGSYDMALWRYTTSGVLDASFGAGGMVIHVDAAGGASDDWADDLIIDSAGRIVATGASYNLNGDSEAVVWRYNATGLIDATFGTGGFVLHDNAAGGIGCDIPGGIIIDGTGRIVVGGLSLSLAGNEDMVIWGFDPSGVLDPTFGTAGISIHTDAAGGVGNDWGLDMARHTGGQIFVVGSSFNPSGDTDMVIWGFDSNGILDPAFGASGTIVHNNAAGGDAGDIAWGVTMDRQGRIVATGNSWGLNGNPDMTVWRFR